MRQILSRAEQAARSYPELVWLNFEVLYAMGGCRSGSDAWLRRTRELVARFTALAPTVFLLPVLVEANASLEPAFFNYTRPLPGYPIEIRLELHEGETFFSLFQFADHDLDHAITQFFFDRWWLAQPPAHGGLYQTGDNRARRPVRDIDLDDFRQKKTKALAPTWQGDWIPKKTEQQAEAFTLASPAEYAAIVRSRFGRFRRFLDALPERGKLNSTKRASLFDLLHESGKALWIEAARSPLHALDTYTPPIYWLLKRIVDDGQAPLAPEASPFMVINAQGTRARWPGSPLPIAFR